MPPAPVVHAKMEGQGDTKEVSFAVANDVIPHAENYEAVDRYVFGEMRRSVRQSSMSSRVRRSSSTKPQKSVSISAPGEENKINVVVIEEEEEAGASTEEENEDNEEEEFDEHAAIARHVEENVVGNDTVFSGPYGEKQIVYCDYTASGRAVKFIEDYITEHVQPLYANTHTTTGVMARQTGKFRKEARDIIKKCVNATDADALIFTGSGTTGAVNKLVAALMLTGERAKKTVVLVGPYEHHSNLLPWKETGAKVIRIRDNSRGLIDMVALEEVLEKHQKKGRHLIGCFSAASNVTGIISDTDSVAALLHRYGALSFWDYATAGPYLAIDMNPPSDDSGSDFSKDAVYLSPHKFVGGVGTPGILIAKKKLFINAVPHGVGGGTVQFVTKETHHYVANIEEREEGGTPAIVESIRAGLTFRLKESISTDYIERREEELTKLAFSKWKKNPNLIFLGSSRANRLPIFSFMVVHPKTGKMLHHHFVAVLLNDLYGIQARGGCACAGPYAQDLLGIDDVLADKFAHLLTDDHKEKAVIKKGMFKRKDTYAEYKHIKKGSKAVEIIKPGFVRLNLPFFFSDDVINYVLEAVDAIGRNGWKLLSQYQVNPMTAEWEYVGKYVDTTKPTPNDSVDGSPSLKQGGGLLVPHSTGPAEAGDSLLTATFKNGKFQAPPSPYFSPKVTKNGPQENSFKGRLEEAEKSMRDAGNQCQFPQEILDDAVSPCISDPALVWFMQPYESAYHIRYPEADSSDPIGSTSEADGKSGAPGPDGRSNLTRVPFKPRRYTKRTLSKRFSFKSRPKTPKTGRGNCSIM